MLTKKQREEIEKAFDGKFVFNIGDRGITGRDKKIKSFMLAVIDAQLARKVEEIRESINTRIKYTGWTHTVGSHSDDKGGESDMLCLCMDAEIKYKTEAYKEVLASPSLSANKGK